MRTVAALLALVVLGLTTGVRADTFILDGIGQAAATAAERPHRGMTMPQVSARWGEPASRVDAVGKPPISRWEYPAFTVYFEHDHVVHAVAKHSG